MAQFKYLNEMTSLLNIDGPLTKGPMARWQRKALESSSCSTNDTINNSKRSTKITPSKRNTGNDVVRVKKTPSKTPSKSKSPSRSTTPTPNDGSKTPGGGDRFIPCRSVNNFDLAHYKLNADEVPVDSPTQKEYQRVVGESLNNGNDITNQRILSYQKKPPAPPEGFQNPMKVLYVHAKTPASVKSNSRYIPQAPDRILDAPDIVDDYYLNLIDWSQNNILAAALGSTVYLWNAGKNLFVIRTHQIFFSIAYFLQVLEK